MCGRWRVETCMNSETWWDLVRRAVVDVFVCLEPPEDVLYLCPRSKRQQCNALHHQSSWRTADAWAPLQSNALELNWTNLIPFCSIQPDCSGAQTSAVRQLLCWCCCANWRARKKKVKITPCVFRHKNVSTTICFTTYHDVVEVAKNIYTYVRNNDIYIYIYMYIIYLKNDTYIYYIYYICIYIYIYIYIHM